jgi:hypothetical protein
VTEGALIFRIVPLGTGPESKVSRSVTRWIGSDLGSTSVLHDSAVVGPSRNPDLYHGRGPGRTCRSDVLGSYIGGIPWAGFRSCLGCSFIFYFSGSGAWWVGTGPSISSLGFDRAFVMPVSRFAAVAA